MFLVILNSSCTYKYCQINEGGCALEVGPNRELAIDLGSTNLPNFFVLSDGPFRVCILRTDDYVVKQTKQYIVQCYNVNKTWGDM